MCFVAQLLVFTLTWYVYSPNFSFCVEITDSKLLGRTVASFSFNALTLALTLKEAPTTYPEAFTLGYMEMPETNVVVQWILWRVYLLILIPMLFCFWFE